MPFLIDGYNLLRAIEKRDEEFEPLSDVKLCHKLALYLKRIRDRAEIIFDGIGPRDKTPFDNIRNLEVIFSGMGIDADTVMEDKILANTAPKRLIVVSNDRRLQAASRKRRTELLKCEVFWAQVEKELRKKRGVKEPGQKRGGELTNGETDRWMELFDLDR